jgi:hypothetical protein
LVKAARANRIGILAGLLDTKLLSLAFKKEVATRRSVDTVRAPLVATKTGDSDVLVKTARANQAGCEAFGCVPMIVAVLSESGICFSATITNAIAASRRVMMVLMKGHRRGLGL